MGIGTISDKEAMEFFASHVFISSDFGKILADVNIEVGKQQKNPLDKAYGILAIGRTREELIKQVATLLLKISKMDEETGSIKKV